MHPLRCSYEDNFDAVNNLAVIVQSVGKDSVDQLGSPDKFLQVGAVSGQGSQDSLGRLSFGPADQRPAKLIGGSWVPTAALPGLALPQLKPHRMYQLKLMIPSSLCPAGLLLPVWRAGLEGRHQVRGRLCPRQGVYRQRAGCAGGHR